MVKEDQEGIQAALAVEVAEVLLVRPVRVVEGTMDRNGGLPVLHGEQQLIDVGKRNVTEVVVVLLGLQAGGTATELVGAGVSHGPVHSLGGGLHISMISHVVERQQGPEPREEGLVVVVPGVDLAVVPIWSEK